MSMATIRMRPTSFSPITVTASTRPIMARSTALTEMPDAVAKSGSNATSVMGRRSSTMVATARAPPTAITTAS